MDGPTMMTALYRPAPAQARSGGYQAWLAWYFG